MKTLKQLRATYGFTQQVMANMLGINLTQWAMAEIEKRPLPKKALDKLAELENFAFANTEAKPATGLYLSDHAKVMKAEYQKTLRGLEQYSQDCDYKRQTLRRKMMPLDQRREKAITTLLLLEQARTKRKASKAELINLRKSESDAKRVLKLIPAIKVEKLKMEISAFDFIDEQIEEQMVRLNKVLKELATHA